MIESALLFFQDFRGSFRIVDAVDILLVSTFLFAALLWFQKTASRGVLIGVCGLAVIYFAAQGLDMYLTSLAFHTTFAILLFILVVMFQEDLRRLLERVSTLGSVRFTPATDVEIELDVDELVEAVFTMAGSKSGALIVVKGKEPLDRHLHGGIKLGGAMSKQLLFSIFDAHSPGHDGAVVVDEDVVEQFAAHLPISKNSREIAGRGTRHSAALGLSERSDALVIVVSEERGIVSVARAGQLQEMGTASDLKRNLEEFLAFTIPQSTQSYWKRFLLHHGRLKVLALALAIVAWFLLAYDPNTVQRTFVVPIEYRNLPNTLKLEGAPDELRVTLSGSERSFRFLDPGSLKVPVDLANVTQDDIQLTVNGDDIRIPANLSLYRIEPRNIFLSLTKRVEAPSKEDRAGEEKGT